MFKLVTFLPHDNDPLYVPLTHNKLHPNKVKNEGKTKYHENQLQVTTLLQQLP